MEEQYPEIAQQYGSPENRLFGEDDKQQVHIPASAATTHYKSHTVSQKINIQGSNEHDEFTKYKNCSKLTTSSTGYKQNEC